MGAPQQRDRSPGPTRRRLTSRTGARVSTLALPAPLHRRLHLAALDRGIAAAQIIREAIEAWLTHYEGKGGPR